MTYVVIGGSAGLGRRISERIAAQGGRLVVASRDARDGIAQASDLSLRYGTSARAVAIDLASPKPDFAALDTGIDQNEPIEAIVITAAEVSDRDVFPLENAGAGALLRGNFLSIALCIDHLLPRLRAGSAIVGLGSVAAFRGRSRNVVYAASKRALASLFESLDHELSARGIRVQFYHVGYLDTNMSFGRRLRLPAASADRLARKIVRNLTKPSGQFYYPQYWRLARPLLQAVPSRLWRRWRE